MMYKILQNTFIFGAIDGINKNRYRENLRPPNTVSNSVKQYAINGHTP